jgi:hypothetical protein
MEVINAPSGFSGAGYLLSGYSNGTQAFYIEGNGTTYFANSLSSNGTMSSNNGYKTASTSLIGFGSGNYNSTADTIFCRGGSAGVVSVESASTCTNTVAGATGTLAASTVNATSGYQLNSTAVTINRDVIHASYVGASLPASQVFGYYVPDSEQTVTVPASCTNSRAVAATAATASTTLTIYSCSTAFSSCSSVGTIVFAASGTTGTFTCSSSFAITGSSGGGLYIQGPSTADSTLGNIAIALYGTHN